VVALELQLNPCILWLDPAASDQMFQIDLKPVLDSYKECGDAEKCRFYPWLLFDKPTNQSIRAATHPKVNLIFYVENELFG